MENVDHWLDTEARSCERKRCDAMLRGNASALEAMLADELIYGHSTGVVDSKHSYLDKIRSGRNVYEELALTVENVVPLYTGAIVVGKMVGKVRLPDRLVNVNSRFMTVWRNHADNWLLVGHQTVAIPIDP